MSTTEVLVTVTTKDGDVLRGLRPYIVEAFTNNEDLILLDSNIEDNIGMSGKDVVLSFLISIAANFAYDGLSELMDSIVETHDRSCVVEIIELTDEDGDIESLDDSEDIKDDSH